MLHHELGPGRDRVWLDVLLVLPKGEGSHRRIEIVFRHLGPSLEQVTVTWCLSISRSSEARILLVWPSEEEEEERVASEFVGLAVCGSLALVRSPAGGCVQIWFAKRVVTQSDSLRYRKCVSGANARWSSACVRFELHQCLQMSEYPIAPQA